MHTVAKQANQGADCSVACGQCQIGAEAGRAGKLSGKRLALAAVGVFLVPLTLSLTAAVLAGSGLAQLLCGFGGLAGGAILAIAAAWIIRRSGKEAL